MSQEVEVAPTSVEESPLPASMWLTVPPLPQETSPVFPLEIAALLPTISYWPIISLKSQKAPKWEVHSMTLQELCFTPKEHPEFPNSYKQMFGRQE